MIKWGSNWSNPVGIDSKKFECFNCQVIVASNRGYGVYVEEIPGLGYKILRQYILICPHCNAPNIFYKEDGTSEIIPLISPPPGQSIKKLPEEIEKVWNEIRTCFQVKAYTASVMLMRKIIMHLAVKKSEEKCEKEGVKEGDSFANYIEYLWENHDIHKNQKSLVNKVKNHGNEVSHELVFSSEKEATDCFDLLERILLNNYEHAEEEEPNKNENEKKDSEPNNNITESS